MTADKRTMIERALMMLLGIAIGSFYTLVCTQESISVMLFVDGFIIGSFAVFLSLMIWTKKAIETFFEVVKDDETGKDDWWRRGEDPPY